MGSRAVRDSIGEQLNFDEIGQMNVKGRLGKIEVYRLAEMAPDAGQNDRPT